tara:strand:- start:5136 stop:6236 length:1101 start_codon:yes stop_codon:yes gene_type:complete
MTIASSKNTPRASYTASASQTSFAIPFEFFSTNDVKVYNGTTLLTYNASPSSASQYSITGTAASSDDAYEFGSGGSITLGGSGASANDIITIIRDITLERTSDFPPTGSFDIATLNTQLDQINAQLADRKQQSDRSIKLADTDSVSATLTLPPKATRASKVLEFDSDGDVATTLSTANLSTLSGLTSEIATVAGISSEITTVSTNNSNISTCATNITAINNAGTHATNAANSATAAATSETNAASSESAAAASASSAAASAGGGTVKVTSADTSPHDLNTKLLVSGNLSKTVNNAGGNETLTLSTIGGAEVYGFTVNGTNNLIVTTTNSGADSISNADYASFDDKLFASVGFTWSLNANGNLIATV